MEPDNLAATLKRMAELQIVFVAKLGERVKELSRLILQLDGIGSVKEPRNQELLQKIHQLSHSLAGSAGTFKQTEVYTKAKAIEEICYNTLQTTTPPAHWHKPLLELIVGLRNDVQISGRPAILEDFHAIGENQAHRNTPANTQSFYPVVVVDDDELLVSLIQGQAKHFEYNIIPLLSTDDLEAAIETYQPEAILIDVMFPDGKYSGIEIINQLKAKNKINCPVIFMSNRSDMAVRLDALRAGSDAYIVKPLDILELIRILDRLTQKLAKQKSKILIVDDEPLTAKLYQTALTGNGFVCEIMLNPMEVINKAIHFKPDAILLDINMPGCNGFELAKVIRQDDAFCHIPILFLTSASGQAQEISAMNSGGDDFLDKNAGLATLIAIIKGHVNRYKELDSVLARLKKDEVRFRSVTSSSTDAIISMDEKGRIVFWNEGAENIFGFHALEMVGQSLQLILLPEQNTNILQNLDGGKIQPSGKHSLERKAVKKDKAEIDIELTYIEWAANSEKFYTAIIRDVSYRKQMEHNLNSQKAYLNAIINNSGEAIITANAEGVIETANPQTLLMFGYQNAELIGRNLSLLIFEMHKQMLGSNLDSFHMTSQIRELTGVHKNGSTFAIELNVSPMMVAEVRKFVAILHDISDRKQFINELVVAKMAAEAASKAKSQFLTSMSHELRTPLNAIMGFAQLLQIDTDNPLNSEQRESLNYIYAGGRDLLQLINEVLSFAEIEAGVLTLQKEKLALIDFVNEFIEQIKPLVTKSGLTINDLKDENVIFVETDKQKLTQVINHLLFNAIKYNKAGGHVSVFLTHFEDRVRLSVADTGKGISETMQAELFENFSRFRGAMGTNEGPGIGLTLAKKLIELLGGKIGVNSTLGEGSTFWIELNTVAQDLPA